MIHLAQSGKSRHRWLAAKCSFPRQAYRRHAKGDSLNERCREDGAGVCERTARTPQAGWQSVGRNGRDKGTAPARYRVDSSDRVRDWRGMLSPLSGRPGQQAGIGGRWAPSASVNVLPSEEDMP